MVKGFMYKRKPMILLFAGPNGAGKSTVTRAYLNHDELVGEYINADDIKVDRACSDMDAAQIATSLRESLMESGEDFTFETVLSTRRNLELLTKAKQKGFFIKAFYVITIDPKINVVRVSDRVKDGGHDVPEDKISSRYYKSRDLVPELISICDVVHIYDNTGDKPERIFKKKREEFLFFETKCWNINAIEKLTGVKYSGGQ